MENNYNIWGEHNSPSSEIREIITSALDNVNKSRVLVKMSKAELEELKAELIKMGIYLT